MSYILYANSFLIIVYWQFLSIFFSLFFLITCTINVSEKPPRGVDNKICIVLYCIVLYCIVLYWCWSLLGLKGLHSSKPQATLNRHNLLPFQKLFDRLIFYSKAQSSTAPNHIRIVLSFPTAWFLYSYWEEGTYYWFKYWQFPILYYNIFFIVIFSFSPFLLNSDARYLSGISWKSKKKEKRDFLGQRRK